MLTDEEIQRFIERVKKDESNLEDNKSDNSVVSQENVKTVVKPVAFPDFSSEILKPSVKASLDYFKDVYVELRIELGQTELKVKEILELAEGSVIELNKAAGESMDVFINERICARAEVIVLNNRFSVRISKVIYPQAGAVLENNNNNLKSKPQAEELQNENNSA